MKLIDQKAELIEQKPGIDGVFEIIDTVAGICYGRNGTNENPRKSVATLVKKGFMRPLEFGTIYLYLESNPENAFKRFTYPLCGFTASYNWSDVVGNTYARYASDKYSESKSFFDGTVCRVYITTNYRVIVENGWEDDLQFLSDKKDRHADRPCVCLTCSMATSDSFSTLTTLSSIVRQTRCCDYSDIEIIKPVWLEKKSPTATTEELYSMLEGTEDPETSQTNDVFWWWYTLQSCEDGYKNMIECGRRRQEAVGVLPMDAGTRLCLCGFLHKDYVDEGWNRFMKLWLEADGHENAKILARQIKEIIIK